MENTIYQKAKEATKEIDKAIKYIFSSRFIWELPFKEVMVELEYLNSAKLMIDLRERIDWWKEEREKWFFMKLAKTLEQKAKNDYF